MEIESLSSTPYSSDKEQSFQESSEAWVKSLIDRHDPGGMLGVLPFDPDKYPMQLSSNVLLPAYKPSFEELMEHGIAGAQNKLLTGSRASCVALIGEENFFGLVNGIANQEASGHKEGVMRTIWGRMNAPRQDVAIITLHSKIMSLPILQVARADAMAGSSYVRSRRFTNSYGAFNLFDYNSQNFTLVNAALGRMGIRQPSGELTPVLSEAAKYSNVVKLVPPTTSAKGIDRAIRRDINKAAMEAFWASIASLHSQNKSAVLTIDPTGSTAESIYEGNKLVTLRHKRLNQLTARMIQDNFRYVVPELCWWDKNPHQASWYLGKQVSLWQSDKSDAAAREFNKVKEELAIAEARLSGAEVEFGHTKTIGEMALTSSHSEST